MREISRFCRLGTVSFVLLFIAAGLSQLRAETASRFISVRSGSAEELNQAELLEAYRTMREQLRSTQTSIINSRAEAEAAALDQAAALAEKIRTINTTLAAERTNRQSEMDRFEFIHNEQQAEISRSNRAVIWVAFAFGSLGLLTMVLASALQWRAINRMAEVLEHHTQRQTADEYNSLPESNGAVSGQVVALSTQRLNAVVDRMERRIKELEHTAIPPSSVLQSVHAKTLDVVI